VAQLPAYLADMQREIERYGREYGLDFWDVEFEILDYKKMQEVAAFGVSSRCQVFAPPFTVASPRYLIE